MKQWFKGLRVKLLALVLFPIALMGILSFFSIRGLQQNGEQIEKLANLRLPLAQMSGEMQGSLQGQIRFLWATMGAGRDEKDRRRYYGRYEEEHKSFEATLAEYEKMPRSDFAREKWKTFESNYPALQEHLKEVGALLAKNTPEGDTEMSEMMRTKVRESLFPIEAMFDELDKARLETSRAESADAISAAHAAVMLIGLMSVFCAVALLAAGFIMATRLAKQLGLITEQVAVSSREVSVASQQLASASQQLSSTSQEQASSLEETSASLQEIAGMVESNERNAGSTVQLAEKAVSTSEEAGEAVADLVRSMDEILRSNERLERLAKLIEEIGEKTELIDEIVFQTKLLSFNASVEAERAGEHGRGFAVVAQEVGNLAQMSGKSAVEIATIVKNAVKEAQEVSTENRKLVEKSCDLGKVSSNSMKSVVSSAKSIVEGSQQILRASQEQTQGIRQITTSVETLNKATQENAATSEEAAASSETLAEQATQLGGLVGELFRIVEGQAEEGQPIPALGPVAAKKPVFKVHAGGAARAPQKAAPAPAPAMKKAAGSEFSGTTDPLKAWEEL